ncbi:unnamed protein product [Heterosigma akashiwo]|mmetsp:Transcript_24344/g.33661  ORF Transcript_24344/g.33661 Transcript_24344/m.33661 type:complete len:416 (-) Transcript_24344:105-1352(-)
MKKRVEGARSISPIRNAACESGAIECGEGCRGENGFPEDDTSLAHQPNQAGPAENGPAPKKSAEHVLQYRAAVIRTLGMVATAALFGFVVYAVRGSNRALEFAAAYLVELSLSVDNLFVFIMLFDYFKVPSASQDRVLKWGILGAVAMRGVMIVVGVELLELMRWMILIFAVILLVSALKLFSEGADDDEGPVGDKLVVRVARRLVGATDSYDGEKFFTESAAAAAVAAAAPTDPGLVDLETQPTGGNSSVSSRLTPTPLFLCLVCIELSDVVFAIDSIPACLGISHSPLVVYSSNLFAIAALRSLFLIVARAVAQLPYLKPAVALVLGFVALKMIAEYFHSKLRTAVSLGVVVALLLGGVLASLCREQLRRGAVFARPGCRCVGCGSSSSVAAETEDVQRSPLLPSPAAAMPST